MFKSYQFFAAIATFLLLHLSGFAQMPDCMNSGGYLYSHEGNNIKNFDVNSPPSATNPFNNTITMPGGAGGLAVSDYLGPGPTYKTFYTCVSNVYWYYNGTAWVSTGHTVGNGAAVNPGAGGGFIYNLVGFTGEVYKYDGTGNGTLLTTVVGFNGGGPFDLVADNDGNWYILKCTTPGYLRKYSPTGVLLKEWSITGQPNTTAGGGFAIVCNEIFLRSSGLYRGTIGDSSIEVSPVTNVALNPSDFASCEIGATAPSGGRDTSMVLYRGCLPGTVDFFVPAADSGAEFTLQFSGTAQNGLDFTYLDSIVTIPRGDSITHVTITPLLRSPSVGDRTLKIEVIGENPCLGGGSAVLRTIDVTILDSLEIDIITPPVTICPGDLITIQATKDPTLDHYWQPAEMLTFIDTLTVTANPTVTTVYSVTATQPGAPSTCPPRTRFYKAVVEPYPIITMPEDRIICLRDSIQFMAYVAPEGQSYKYLWSPAQGLSNPNVLQPMFWSAPGVYQKTLTVSTPVANCTSVDSFVLTVAEPFKITAKSNDTTIRYGDAINLFADGKDALLWSWTPTTNLREYFVRQVLAYPKENTVYKVIVHDKYGCFDEAEIRVNVEYNPKLMLPNAFSPNGDGLNDEFKFVGVRAERLSIFQVFDRYGTKVFETTDIQKGWDGTYLNNKEAAPGVYYYHIQYFDVRNEINTIKGDVTLVR